MVQDYHDLAHSGSCCLKHSTEELDVEMRSINDLDPEIGRIDDELEANDEEKNILREKKCVWYS